MKALLRFFVLVSFFIGSLNLGSAHGLYSGHDMGLIQGKQGTVNTFIIPIQYLGKNGELTTPMIITVSKENKIIFEVITLEREFTLPSFSEKGLAVITVKIEEPIHEGKIDLSLF